MNDSQLERELLEKYASASKHSVIASRADLKGEDQLMPEMHTWCKRQGNIAVLKNGSILSSNPSSRAIQNCKIVMINKGLQPGRVLAATGSLIHMLLTNAEELIKPESEKVSSQQHRLRMLVKEAVNANASDIHIEVREDIARIRFRKHGELFLHAEWLPQLGREIASVAFNKETDHAVTHFNPLVPQNASMPLSIEGKPVRLRLASLPAHGGFDLVMRLLTTETERVRDLSELGYNQEHVRLLERAIHAPHGAIILAGPTGSGKTTTMASCVKMVGSNRKIYTIEDPVEKVVSNATQIPVNTEHDDRGFANMGRSALRMDPDVMVLGEMRDEDTARVMIRASITGHLVFSTLHTNSAPAIITRLIDMGVSPTMLGDPNLLTCLICQRLIPKLCQSCAVPVKDAPQHQEHLTRWQQTFGDDFTKLKARGKHCTECGSLSISARTVIAEVIWIDDKSREFIHNGDVLGWEKYLRENNWQPYSTQAIDLVRQGLVDPLDAEKIIGELA